MAIDAFDGYVNSFFCLAVFLKRFVKLAASLVVSRVLINSPLHQYKAKRGSGWLSGVGGWSLVLP